MEAHGLLEEAKALLQAGDAVGALAKADEALAAGAPRGEALRIKAAASVQLGRTDVAEKTLGELAEIRPDDAWAYVQLAAVHFAAGRPAKARVLLERALILEPDNPDARSLMGHLEAAGVPATPGQAEKAARQRRRFLVPIFAAVGLAAVVLGALLIWWLVARARPGPGVQQAQVPPPAAPELPQPVAPPPAQPPVVEAQQPPAARPQLTQPTPAPPPQPEVTAAQPPPPAQPEVAAAQPAPQPPPAPKKPGDLKVVWYQARLIDRQRYGDQEQHKYQIWGEVINDGDEMVSGVVVGWVLIRGAAVAWGVQAIYNVPPQSKAQFNMLAPSQALSAGSPEGDACQVVAGPLTKNVEALLDAGNVAAILQQFGLSGGGGLGLAP